MFFVGTFANALPQAASLFLSIKHNAEPALAAVAVVSATAPAELLRSSPTSPAPALSFVAVPFICPLVRAAGSVPEPRLLAFSAVRLVPTPADGVPMSPPWK